MPRRIQLPPELRTSPFAVADARLAGVGAGRLRGADLDRPFRGIRRSRATPAPWEGSGSAAEHADGFLALEGLCRAYLLCLPPYGVFCSVTAALLLGMPLPLRLERGASVHVAARAPARAPRGAGVRGHKLALGAGDVLVTRGLPCTSAERTWLDLGPLLTVPELVAAGDFIIHWRSPLTTLESLRARVDSSPGRRGIAKLREALTLLHDRSESARESLLRVILVRGGIRDLEINYVIRLPGVRTVYRADFAIVRLKVIFEYQGDHHRGQAQWRSDMTRISRFEAHRWTVIQVNAGDLEDPTELLERIRRVIAHLETGS